MHHMQRSAQILTPDALRHCSPAAGPTRRSCCRWSANVTTVRSPWRLFPLSSLKNGALPIPGREVHTLPTPTMAIRRLNHDQATHPSPIQSPGGSARQRVASLRSHRVEPWDKYSREIGLVAVGVLVPTIMAVILVLLVQLRRMCIRRRHRNGWIRLLPSDGDDDSEGSPALSPTPPVIIMPHIEHPGALIVSSSPATPTSPPPYGRGNSQPFTWTYWAAYASSASPSSARRNIETWHTHASQISPTEYDFDEASYVDRLRNGVGDDEETPLYEVMSRLRSQPVVEHGQRLHQFDVPAVTADAINAPLSPRSPPPPYE
ncbi:hypothetical protein BD413DRAFT_594146 [Trametes elegans]|nr:hypothetical protein BD413DRAFT_594146 [Trametes elegans]